MIFRITRAHKYQFLETWLYPIPFHFNLTGPLIFSFLRKMFDQGREDSVEEEILAKTERDEKKERTLLQDTLQLTFCAGGLQVSYLTWGILQVSVSLYLYKQKFSLIVVFFVFLGGVLQGQLGVEYVPRRSWQEAYKHNGRASNIPWRTSLMHGQVYLSMYFGSRRRYSSSRELKNNNIQSRLV